MKNHFVDLASLGLISTIIGVVEITYGLDKPFVGFLSGPVGIIFSIISLRGPKREKLERGLSWLGIILSVISIIWGLVNIYGS